jgi:hypothetical protein
MDELIKVLVTIVALVVLSGISSWMRKREAGDQADHWPDETTAPRPRTPSPMPRPRPAAPSPPTQGPTSWEEELRRLLTGEAEPPPPPPPVVIQETRPTPAPPSLPEPVLAAPMRTYSSVETAAEEGPKGESPGLVESRRAHERAVRIHQDTSERLEHAAQSATPPAKVMRRIQLAPDIRDLARGLHSRSNARRAFVASLIFSPPKAFES